MRPFFRLLVPCVTLIGTMALAQSTTTKPTTAPTTAPATTPSAITPNERQYYTQLYARYKASILADAKAGDTAAVTKTTAAFNESIGGKLLFTYITRIDGDDKSTQVLSLNDKRALGIPAINYGRYEPVHVTPVQDRTPQNDFILLETSEQPPAVPYTPGGPPYVTHYDDNIYITIGLLPALTSDIPALLDPANPKSPAANTQPAPAKNPP